MYVKNQKKFLAADYLRLSNEDGDKTESNSIRNQRSLIQDFVSRQKDITLVEEYVDDGYSGANYDRPSFQKMMEDVRSGKINCIIVKDLSRLGRNYIETGRYIENIFPVLGVRFIAVNDNYDSADTKNDADQIIVPFKNLINDAYCRDISMKIRSQLEMKRKNGQFTGSYAAYGYKKDPKDKNHLIIDPYAAEIVRDIFRMKIEGYNNERIAEKLNEMGILIPMEYKRSCGLNFNSGFRSGKNPKWGTSSVLRILKNEIYTGTMVQGKTRKVNYRVKDCIPVEAENWIRVENTHEPIIDKDIFECVQQLMTLDTRTSPEKDNVYAFSGLLRCGDCGQNLNRRCVRKKEKKYYYYHCKTYKNGEGCTLHTISEIALMKVIMDSLKKQIALIVKADEVLAKVKNLPQQNFEVKTLEKQVNQLEIEIQKYGDLGKKLYQDMLDEVITKEEYQELKNNFSQKLEAAQITKEELEKKIAEKISDESGTDKWVEELKKYQNIETIDRKTAVMLFDKIVVYATKEIEVHFKFKDEIHELLEYASQYDKTFADETDGKVVEV